MKLPGEVEPEPPGEAEHQDSLEGVRPADPHDPAAGHVDEHHAVGQRGARPFGHPTLGHHREDVARPLHLDHEIGDERRRAHDRHDRGNRLGAFEPVREELGLGHEPEPPPEHRDPGSEEIPGQEAHRPVGDDVERRRAPRVGPARRPQKGEGAVDGRPHDEVEEEEAQAPVAGDVPFGSVRDVPAGRQPDRQRDEQVGERRQEDDDPGVHRVSLGTRGPGLRRLPGPW